MKKTLLLILFFLLFSCKKSEDLKEISSKKTVVVKKNDPKMSDEAILKIQAEQEKIASQIIAKFTRKIKANGFLYTLFCEQRKDSIINFKSIKIFKNKKTIQEINNDTMYVYRDDQIEFNVDTDVNFDGKNDLSIINWAGMYASSSSYFLFDLKTKTYKHCKDLDHVDNLGIDNEKKQIVSEFHVGPESNTTIIYQWKKGLLSEISRTKAD